MDWIESPFTFVLNCKFSFLKKHKIFHFFLHSLYFSHFFVLVFPPSLLPLFALSLRSRRSHLSYSQMRLPFHPVTSMFILVFVTVFEFFRFSLTILILDHRISQSRNETIQFFRHSLSLRFSRSHTILQLFFDYTTIVFSFCFLQFPFWMDATNKKVLESKRTFSSVQTHLDYRPFG